MGTVGSLLMGPVGIGHAVAKAQVELVKSVSHADRGQSSVFPASIGVESGVLHVMSIPMRASPPMLLTLKAIQSSSVAAAALSGVVETDIGKSGHLTEAEVEDHGAVVAVVVTTPAVEVEIDSTQVGAELETIVVVRPGGVEFQSAELTIRPEPVSGCSYVRCPWTAEETSHGTHVGDAQVGLLNVVVIGGSTTTAECVSMTHLTHETGVVVDLRSQVVVSPGCKTGVKRSGVAVFIAKANVATQRNVSVCKGRSRNQHGHKKAEHDALFISPLFFPMLGLPSILWGS